MSNFSYKEELRAYFKGRQYLSKALPLMVGSLPFISPSLSLLGGAIGACSHHLYKEKITALDTIDIDDVIEEALSIAPSSVWTSLYLGQGIDFQLWKLHKSALREKNEAITANMRRTLTETIYPLMTPLAITEDILTRHMALLMPTGGCKTEPINSILYQQIKRGGGGYRRRGKI